MEITKEQIQAEAKACDDRKVEQARRMSLQEKLRAGAELFEDACQMTLRGIRMQHPDWDEQACFEELKRRVALA